MSRSPELSVRAAIDADEPAVVALLRDSLGWPQDAPMDQFYRWKHHANPFGRSPAWVAEQDGRLVGLRVLLRWEFVAGGTTLRAVRAVDTATAPTHQGRGIFTRLTLHAIEDCRAQGVDLVFNTPNAKSRPGYLKMGWQVVGRLPTAFRPCRIGGLPALFRAGVAAERFSTPSSAGVAAAEALGDEEAVTELLSRLPPSGRLRTNRSVAYLRWRYAGFAPLHYRAVVGPAGVGDGLAIFRLRRRGPALEAAVVEVLSPANDARATRRLLGRVARTSGPDYAIVVGATASRATSGFVPLPGRGPVLTCRPLSGYRCPARSDWDLGLGDVELF